MCSRSEGVGGDEEDMNGSKDFYHWFWNIKLIQTTTISLHLHGTQSQATNETMKLVLLTYLVFTEQCLIFCAWAQRLADDLQFV